MSSKLIIKIPKKIPRKNVITLRKKKIKKSSRSVTVKSLSSKEVSIILSFCNWKSYFILSFVNKRFNKILNSKLMFLTLCENGEDVVFELDYYFQMKKFAMFIENENGVILEIVFNKDFNIKEYFNDCKEESEKKFRVSYRIKKKREIVQEIFDLKKKCQNEEERRKVVSFISNKYGIDDTLLRKWEKNEKLLPGYVPDKFEFESDFRLGKPGPEFKLNEKQLQAVRKWIKEQYEDEEQVCYEDLQEYVEEKFDITLSDVDLCRLLKYKEVDSTTRTKTNKSIKDIDPVELQSHLDKLEFVKKLPFVIIGGSDEKPMKILYISNKGIVPKGVKQVRFNDGGRGCKTTETLDPGTFVVLKFGLIDFFGTCGLGVLMKGGTEGEKPQCLSNLFKHFTSEERQILKDMYLEHCKKGVMKSFIYPRYLNFHMKIIQKKVVEYYELDSDQFKQSPKYFMNDGAPGHNDKKGFTVLHDFWEKKKRKNNWEEWRIPKNSSDSTQSGDLGPNKKLQDLYKPLSREWVKSKPKTAGGKFKKPGKKQKIKWYIEIWKQFNSKHRSIIRTCWEKAGVTNRSTLQLKKKK